MSDSGSPPSGLAGTVGDADRWREAARLREEFRGWIVIWLAPEKEFRAYRRLPGTRRDTALAAPASEDLAEKIRLAEQARMPRGAVSGPGQP